MANHSKYRNEILEFLNESRHENAITWFEGDSKYFRDNGYYSWMCNFVEGYTRVLEIGVGSGYSTMALVNSGHQVISIDENPECLEIAYQNLKKSGINCSCIHRGNIKPMHSIHGYGIEYDKVDINYASDVILLEGDIIADSYLYLWLKSLPKFDAVISWLIGTHKGRSLNMICHNIDSPAAYRLTCENKTYELANEILRPCGILNIIDRTQKLDGEQEKVLYESHIAQAQPTTLEVSRHIYQKEYETPDNGVPMGGVDKSKGLVLVSIISVKK